MRCGVGYDDTAPVGVIVVRRQWNSEAALIRHSHHADEGAHRSWQRAATTRRRVRFDLTKYSQPTHNALRFSERREGAAIRPKCARRTAVTHVVRAQVAMMCGGITNAPTTSNRLGV
jgi:hypothetical protein